MRSVIAILGMILFALYFNTHVFATEVTDMMVKKFKDISFPHSEKIVRIQVETPVIYLPGKSKERDIIHTVQVHEKIVSVLGKNGWRQKDDLLTDYIDGGKLEVELAEGMNLKLETTQRLKLFLHMCDSPMRKYRGGDLDEFLVKAIERAEYCLTLCTR